MRTARTFPVLAIALILQLSISPLNHLSAQTSKFPFNDPKLPLDDRVNDLVARMTLEEKVSQMQNGAAAIERLGVPEYEWWNEALHGVARSGVATVFPAGDRIGGHVRRESRATGRGRLIDRGPSKASRVCPAW
jgi:beta-glucosidase